MSPSAGRWCLQRAIALRAGDSITIDNNAVVTLDSATASILTFNAGDDIIFDSGRAITQNGVHSVVLAADLDHAGIGAADGDRGAITQDGLVGIEVTTNNLNATAASGIDLDTAVDTLQATTTSTGNIQIDEQNAITLANVSTADGAITITAGGTLTAISVSSLGTDSDANDVSLSTVGAGRCRCPSRFGRSESWRCDCLSVCEHHRW